MKTNEFKKLLKEKDPQKIIYDHTNWKIFLTNKQIDECIRIRDEKRKTNEKAS